MINVDLDKVRDVAINVTEVFAFMFAEPVGPSREPAEIPADGYRTSISFSGAGSGCLNVCISADLARDMAANATGNDDVAEEEILDAMKEYANQLCGQMLTTLAGQQPVFILGIPEAEQVDFETMRAVAARPDCVQLVVEDMDPVLLYFECEPAREISV